MTTITNRKAENLPAKRSDLSEEQWRVLREALFPNASTDQSIEMALAYCASRKLDIFMRPVNIVSVWDANKQRMVETVWPAISLFRTTAARTGEYAGKDPIVFGPDRTEQLGQIQMTYPEYAELTVYRLVKGARCPFPERVYWKEIYVTKKKGENTPNAMWQKRPRGQLGKCVEAAALRAAFPEELGGEWTAEEMEGRVVGDMVDVTPKKEDPPEKETPEPKPFLLEFVRTDGEVLEFENPGDYEDAFAKELAAVQDPQQREGFLETNIETARKAVPPERLDKLLEDGIEKGEEDGEDGTPHAIKVSLNRRGGSDWKGYADALMAHLVETETAEQFDRWMAANEIPLKTLKSRKPESYDRLVKVVDDLRADRFGERNLLSGG